MTEPAPAPAKPRFGIGALVAHPHFGRGRVMAYDGDGYVILFKDQARRVGFSFDLLQAEGPAGDPELDRVRQAVREALGECGWIDADLELGKRWAGGTMKLLPGKTDTHPKDIPIEAFFAKIVGIRDKLRVLEQKLNANAALAPEEKLELQGYITRCYGSLTTFNALFAAKESCFKGQSKEE
jgi:hypothetical protein